MNPNVKLVLRVVLSFFLSFLMLRLFFGSESWTAVIILGLLLLVMAYGLEYTRKRK
jgi:hypothetical protein